jgi:hypothetical protein
MAAVENEKPYIFTYQTKCIVNNKMYIGYHSTYKMNDGYIGCGVRSQAYAVSSKNKGLKSAFIDAVVKYGYENFRIEYLSFFDTVEEAKEEEAFLVNESYVRRSDNYNIALGGRGGFPLTTPKEKRNEIMIDFMSGMKKNDVISKYGITPAIMYRITKLHDVSGRKNALTDKSIFIKDWIRDNSEYYIRKYVNREITKDQLNNITPFYFWKNDFIGNIKQNPILYLYINSDKIPIYGSSDIVKYTGDKKARVGLALKFCKRGKEYRGHVFSEN